MSQPPSHDALRLAPNNADWYRLLDLCGMTDTLIGDADGVYQPGLFNDRLVLGLKGTMSEAELHILRARLDGGIRNKATRGELRRRLPVGFVWGEEDGEVRFHPDEAVTSSIRTVFERFAELGSARRVWLKGRYRHVPVPETGCFMTIALRNRYGRLGSTGAEDPNTSTAACAFAVPAAVSPFSPSAMASLSNVTARCRL